jgi:hypothetical protein
MKNLHLLPTDKPSRLHYYSVLNFGVSKENLNWKQGRHIYITSDEEIKEGDWFFNGEHILQCSDVTDIIIDTEGQWSTIEDCKKIILTTDPDLIKDGVQSINDEFLEWFVNNPTCNSVEVKWVKTPDGIFYHKDNVPYGYYKIIIPQEDKINLSESLMELKEDNILEMFINEQGYPDGPTQEVWSNGVREGIEWYRKKDQKIIPNDATDVEVFAIKEDADGKPFAYIGYKISNGNFHFTTVPFTEPKQEKMYTESEVLKLLVSCKDRFGGSELYDYTSDKEVINWFKRLK